MAKSLFRLFMRRMSPAKLTELFKLQAFFKNFLVLLRVVVHPLALGAFELDHVILGHIVIDKKRKTTLFPVSCLILLT